MGEEEHKKPEVEEDSEAQELIDEALGEKKEKHSEEIKEEPKEEVKEESHEEKVEEVKEEPQEKEEVEEEPKEEHKEESEDHKEEKELEDEVKAKKGFLGLFKQKKKEEPKEEKHEHKHEKKEVHHEHKEKLPFLESIKDYYDTKYKKLLVIPFAILLIALILIGVQIATTGDFVRKDVSLKGGLTITIPSDDLIDVDDIELHLAQSLPNADLSVRALKRAGQQVGIIIDGADVESDDIIDALESKIGELGKDDYSVEFMGSSLGESFFKEIIKAIYVSFLFMGIVVFWYFGKDIKLKILATVLTLVIGMLMFSGSSSLVKDIIAYILGVVIIGLYIKTSAPSFMVIFNVFSDLVVSLAVVNLLGIKLSTAGIAAFLMIIGYSVDTNILLSTKLIKRKEGSISSRLFDAMKTGLTMTLTTSAAVLVALIFTQSDVIRQIMIILLIGLVVDTIYTWIQNVGILRIYLEKHKHE